MRNSLISTKNTLLVEFKLLNSMSLTFNLLLALCSHENQCCGPEFRRAKFQKKFFLLNLETYFEGYICPCRHNKRDLMLLSFSVALSTD